MTNPATDHPNLLGVEVIETVRLKLSLATDSDTPGIAVLFEENIRLFPRFGLGGTAEDFARDIVEYLTLPPDGIRSQARTFAIRLRREFEPIGVVEIYAGHPDPQTLYIADLFLHPRVHRGGVGTEVMAEIEKRAWADGFLRARLAVDSGNWKALKFWVRLGYDRITKLVDVSVHSDTPPRIELEKTLHG